MAEEQHRLAEDEQMPKVGSLVGSRYEIKSVLGEGGFAAVFKAYDTRTKTDVAIKVLDPIMSRRSEFSERFLREVSTVAQLRHHNTIKIFDSGETDTGCLYLVMELLRGEPLDEILEKKGPLPPQRVKRIVQQVLKSLYEAHEIGVIHRDLKPANVFIADLAGEQDYVKVLDFGIAKSIDDSQNSSLTATGQVMCSPDYVAPERVRDHVAYPASDIYSLGIMMIEMLDGGVPYTGDSPMMVALQHVKIDEPVPMTESTEHGPLGWVIQKACSKDLSQRYTSASEMLEDLTSVSFDGVDTRPHQAAPAAASAPSAGRKTAASPAASATMTDVEHGRQAGGGTVAAGDDTFAVEQKKSKALPIIIAALSLVLIGGIAAFLLTGDDTAATENTTTASEEQPALDEEAGEQGAEQAATTQEVAAATAENAQQVEEEVSTVSVTTEPEGVNVFVNDEELGATPAKLDADDIETYPAQLRFELEGYETQTQTVESRESLLAGIGTITMSEAAESTAASEPTAEEIRRRQLEEARQRAAEQRARERQQALERQRREEQAQARAQQQQQQEEQAAAEEQQANQQPAEQAEESQQASETGSSQEEESSGRPSRIIDLRPRQ
jgi:serine/threonine-protein kinase